MQTHLQSLLDLIERQEVPLGQAQVYEWSWEMHSRWGWLWVVGLILIILTFCGIFFLGLVVAIRWILGVGRVKTSDTAVEILRQRYARGEITKEEFEAKKSDLR